MALGLEALGLLPRNLAGALRPKAQSASGGRYHWLVYEIENFPFRIEGCLSAARAYHIGLPVVWEFPLLVPSTPRTTTALGAQSPGQVPSSGWETSVTL